MTSLTDSRARFGSTVTKVGDCVAAYSDAGLVWVVLGGSYFTDYLGVGDICDAVLWDVVEVDRAHGVGSRNSLGVWL
jgi:hypothetical protein